MTTLEKKIKEKYPATKVKDIIETKDLSTSWHFEDAYACPYGVQIAFESGAYITLSTMPSGCGSVLMSAYCYNSWAEKDLPEFNNLCAHLKDTGVGAIFTTIGQSYPSITENLITLFGFVELKEYANYRHGANGNYKQKLLAKFL